MSRPEFNMYCLLVTTCQPLWGLISHRGIQSHSPPGAPHWSRCRAAWPRRLGGRSRCSWAAGAWGTWAACRGRRQRWIAGGATRGRGPGPGTETAAGSWWSLSPSWWDQETRDKPGETQTSLGLWEIYECLKNIRINFQLLLWSKNFCRLWFLLKLSCLSF